MDEQKKITDQQNIFIDSYLVHFNACRAAKEAGFKHPLQYGYQLLRKPHIKEEIDSRTKVISDSNKHLKNRIIQELTSIAFSSICDVGEFGEVSGFTLYDSKDLSPSILRSISEVNTTSTEKGTNTRVKLHSKIQALEILGKHLGMFKEQTLQVEVKPYIIRRLSGEEIELGVKKDEKEDELDE